MRAEYDWAVKSNPVANVFSALLPLILAFMQPTIGGRGPSIAKGLNNFFGSDTGAEAITKAYASAYLKMDVPPESAIKFLSDTQMWVNREVVLNPAYKSDYMRAFAGGDPFEVIDFSKPQQVTQTFNTWVSKATDKHIQTLTDGPLLPSTQYVAASALFLNAPWSVPFDPALTMKNATFTGADGKPVMVEMMSSKSIGQPAALIQSDSYSALALPFGNGEFSLVAIKPETLTADAFRTLIPKMPQIERDVLQAAKSAVVVRMPPIKFSVSENLADALSASALAPLFAAGANYSGMGRELKNPLI